MGFPSSSAHTHPSFLFLCAQSLLPLYIQMTRNCIFCEALPDCPSHESLWHQDFPLSTPLYWFVVLLQFPKNSLLIMLLFNEQFLYVSWIRIHLLEKFSPNLPELEYLEAKERDLPKWELVPGLMPARCFIKPMLTQNDLKQQSIAWYEVSFSPQIWSLCKITF